MARVGLTAVGWQTMEKPSTAGFEEFGDNAEHVAVLFMRADISTEGMGDSIDTMLSITLQKMFRPEELVRILAMVAEKEAAQKGEDVDRTVAMRLDESKGWFKQWLPWISADKKPAPPPKPAPSRKADYGAVRRIVETAQRAQEDERFFQIVEDAFAEYDEWLAEAKRRQAGQN